MSRPYPSRNYSSSGSFVRINGKIRAREVRVIGIDGKQVGVLSLGEALTLARSHGVDLVEVSANATPPVCRLVDYGKFRYEQAKKDKESKKHQHATLVKEVQLSPRIDPHDLSVKIAHAVGFLCEDMKVKVTLKFRGREMAHTEFGFQVVQKLLADISPYGHPDFEPKLIGRGITVMISPLPRNKRARNPHQSTGSETQTAEPLAHPKGSELEHSRQDGKPGSPPTPPPAQKPGGFANTPFAEIELK